MELIVKSDKNVVGILLDIDADISLERLQDKIIKELELRKEFSFVHKTMELEQKEHILPLKDIVVVDDDNNNFVYIKLNDIDFGIHSPLSANVTFSSKSLTYVAPKSTPPSDATFTPKRSSYVAPKSTSSAKITFKSKPSSYVAPKSTPSAKITFKSKPSPYVVAPKSTPSAKIRFKSKPSTITPKSYTPPANVTSTTTSPVYVAPKSKKCFLRAPSALDVKGIKKFICPISLKPGEKRRREFLNLKMEEIANKNPSSSKKIIIDEANKCWILKKADDFTNDFGGVSAALVMAAKKNGKLNLKKNTISNSLERISSLKTQLEKSNNVDKSYYASQLRKAMDALRKITSLRMHELNKILMQKNNDDGDDDENDDDAGDNNDNDVGVIKID